jgi:hypothetical protein
MSRRIDIELTSARDGGGWNWRAAGAREPKGVVAGSIVGDDAKVGDVLKVEADFFVDGIQITSVVKSSRTRTEVQRLEILGSGKADEPLVTTTLARGDRDRDRGPRKDRPRREGDRPRRDGERGERREGDRPPREGDRPKREGERGGDRGERRDAPRRSRPPRPEAPPIPVVERPKAKRLRAGKAHRTALLESLPEEQRPIAEQVVLGGMPAVRQAIEKQNAERTAGGEAAIAAGPLLELAEKLVPKVRAAEWRDRAEAAQKDLETLDLRDLRSVVSAADSAPRDDESRALVQALRDGLSARVDAEHAAWLEELTANVEVGRIVRALRLSSRPPKAGAPLPADLATKLTEQAGAALTADAAPERWVAVLDALAFSPVRDKVIPTSLPTGDLHADVQATIARLATRVPKLAHIFEIAPDPSAPRPRRRLRPRRRSRPRRRLRPPLQIPRRDDAALAGAALEVAAPGVLVPPGPARRAGARVERQRREVEPLHLVRLAERAAQVVARFGRRHRPEPTARG